jgi:dTDP-4-amino-4,6-dideoxygalactose transaminase
MTFEIPFYTTVAMHNQIRDEVMHSLEKVYDSGKYVLGNELGKFERAYAEFSGAKYCIGVSNGLDALKLALSVLGIGKGDEVIVPAHTFIATWLAVTHTGAIPVPVEPEQGTCNINPHLIASRITAKTKAIIVVHLYGLPCDMDAVMEIAASNNLFVIEDNAQAQGALYKGRPTGSLGHLNATSFYPAKNLGALGDGGAITTNDFALAGKIKEFRNYGSAEKYIHHQAGYNARLDEIQAAVLSVKLKYLKEWNRQRNQLALGYQQQLNGIGDIVLQEVPDFASHVFHLFVIRTKHREKLREFLMSQGIETLMHYPILPYLQDAYKFLGCRQGDFPIAESIATTCLSLPLYPGMELQTVEKVCQAVRKFF